MTPTFHEQSEMLLQDMREDLVYLERRLANWEKVKSEIETEIGIIKRGIKIVEEVLEKEKIS